MTSPRDMTSMTTSVPYTDEMRADEDEIPIRVTLGDAVVVMGPSGHWEMEHSALQEYMDQVDKLKVRNEKLENDNAELKERCTRLTEEANMDKFKCQLLVEMLALSSLDEERSRGEANQERAKVASMRNDVLALMEKARREGIDLQNLTSGFSVP